MTGGCWRLRDRARPSAPDHFEAARPGQIILPDEKVVSFPRLRALL